MFIKVSRLSPVFLCISFSLLVVLPFFYIGEVPNSGCCGGSMPVTHDSWMHYNQMRSFWEGMAAGSIYPRWDEATHGGYGAPITIFYPPGVYFLTSAFYLVLSDWGRVLVALHLTTIAASGAAIYLYARRLMSRSASLIAMSVYIVAPYHLINLYQRGAIAEQLGFVWAPLVLMFADQLMDSRNRFRSGRRLLIAAAGLAASFGAFLWSHPPTAYQLLMVFGLGFGLRFVWRSKKNISNAAGDAFSIVLILCAPAFGSMLAAAYFFPALIEQNLINADDVEKTWPYHSSYVFDDGQTIYDHREGFIARIDRIWVFNAAVITLAGIALFFIRKQFQSVRLRSNVMLWFFAGGLAAFLMTKYSYPIGKYIPGIEIGVFSWRLLAMTSLVISLLAGACLQVAIKRKQNVVVVYGVISIIVLISTAVVSFNYVIKPVYRAEAFYPVPEHYNYSTLPKGVPRDVPKMDRGQLAGGNGRVIIERWSPEFRRLRVELEKADQLQIRTSNFPGWTAIVDGRPQGIKNGPVQNIVIDLPPGTHQVELSFRPTLIGRVGNWITVISFFFLISIVVIARREVR